MGDSVRVQVAFAPSWHLINHRGQLSLAMPPRVGAMSFGDGYHQCQGRKGEFCVTVGPVWHTDLVG